MDWKTLGFLHRAWDHQLISIYKLIELMVCCLSAFVIKRSCRMWLFCELYKSFFFWFLEHTKKLQNCRVTLVFTVGAESNKYCSSCKSRRVTALNFPLCDTCHFPSKTAPINNASAENLLYTSQLSSPTSHHHLTSLFLSFLIEIKISIFLSP